MATRNEMTSENTNNTAITTKKAGTKNTTTIKDMINEITMIVASDVIDISVIETTGKTMMRTDREDREEHREKWTGNNTRKRKGMKNIDSQLLGYLTNINKYGLATIFSFSELSHLDISLQYFVAERLAEGSCPLIDDSPLFLNPTVLN